MLSNVEKWWVGPFYILDISILRYFLNYFIFWVFRACIVKEVESLFGQQKMVTQFPSLNFHHSSLITHNSSLITHHSIFHIRLPSSLSFHHSLFFTLFGGPTPVIVQLFFFFSSSFFFFFFSLLGWLFGLGFFFFFFTKFGESRY